MVIYNMIDVNTMINHTGSDEELAKPENSSLKVRVLTAFNNFN